MATLEEVQANVAAINETLVTVDGKVADIAAIVSGLKAGQVVSQDQLDSLNATIVAARDEATKVLGDTSALDTAPAAQSTGTTDAGTPDAGTPPATGGDTSGS